jgi:hypothetical protein
MKGAVRLGPVLAGCTIALILVGVGFSAFMWWGYHKAKTYVAKTVERSGIANSGAGSMTAVPELWSDVPRMPGMTRAQQVDMPGGLKLVARPLLDGMMRGLNNGADPGRWDWTAFSVAGRTSTDVQTFYVPARMASSGWEPHGGCVSLPAGVSGGTATFCSFQKHEGGRASGLLIVATDDEKERAVSMFFIRQDAPGGGATAAAQPIPAPAGAPGTAPVPYGVDRRPMPNGVDLDSLLPARVGPYSRTGLRRAGSNAAPAMAVVDDGNSIYADYQKSGARVFVELAVTSKPQFARSVVQTVADESIGRGRFPSDPRSGRLGPDPSYLRLVTPEGAIYAWTRGGYFFSASTSTEAALDEFVASFPY